MKKNKKNKKPQNNNKKKNELHFGNMCLVSQMNKNVSLCDENYSQECFKILEENDDFSPVVLCQNSGKNNILNRIKLTSGVKMNINRNDLKNRRYRDIKQAIIEEDNHIIIVGSDIVNCYKDDKNNKQEELLKKVKLYSNISYKYFNEKHNVVANLLKENNVNKMTISNMFNEVFKISGEEEDIIIKEENLKQREENIIIKEHVLYTIMMLLTIVFNYETVIYYIL